MKKYKNLGGNSGVREYEYGDDYIKVKFKDGSIYTYTYKSAGKENIETMKMLADNGIGLNSFIMRVVKYNYSDKQLP